MILDIILFHYDLFATALAVDYAEDLALFSESLDSSPENEKDCPYHCHSDWANNMWKYWPAACKQHNNEEPSDCNQNDSNYNLGCSNNSVHHFRSFLSFSSDHSTHSNDDCH